MVKKVRKLVKGGVSLKRKGVVSFRFVEEVLVKDLVGVKKKVLSIDDVVDKHMGKRKVEEPKVEVKGEELAKIVQPYRPVPLTESSYFVFMKQLDYDRLYSYLGRTKSAVGVVGQEYSGEVKHFVSGSGNVFSYSEIADYLKKFTINNLLGAQMNSVSIKEREVFNTYALFNRQHVILGMLNLGVVQTDIPMMIYSGVKNEDSSFKKEEFVGVKGVKGSEEKKPLDMKILGVVRTDISMPVYCAK